MQKQIAGAFVVSSVLLAVAGLSAADDVGRVCHWLLAGPFPSDEPAKLLEEPPVGDPAELAPAAGQTVGKTKWIEHTTPTGVISFRDKPVIHSVRNCVIAGASYVYSPRTQPAKLLLGFQRGLAVYLNGRRVYLSTRGALRPDAYRTEVLLGKGWNRLLVLNARFTSGRWVHGFSVRLTDPDLKAVAGWKVTTKNPFPGGKAAMPEYDPHVSAYAVEQFGTHRIRLTNRTPIELKAVKLSVRSRAGRELMKANLGKLAGHAFVEADVDADEVYYQKHYGGATAVVRHAGGSIEAKIERLKLPGAHSIEYETPHIQRMKPWSAGRPVVLILVRGKSRQPIELVERGDFEWHLLDTAAKDAGKQLSEELSLYKFDCILLAPQSWNKLANVTLLQRAVKNGAGLVAVNPADLTPAAEAALGIAAGSQREREARAARPVEAADHPVVAGVPVEALPQLRPYGYTLAAGAVAAVKAGDRAVVAATEKAGRRAVLLNLGRGAQLIWPIGRDACCEPRLPVWERQWSLVLKAVLWAAKKDGPARMTASVPAKIGRDELAQAKLKVTIALPSGDYRPAGASKVEAVFRSRGLSGSAAVKEIALRGGSQEFEFPLPASLEAGENEADVVLKTAGQVASWATAVFTVTPRGSIGQIALAPKKDYYLPGDKLTFTVPGKADADGLTLHARLTDNRGRVVVEEKRRVKKGDFSEAFSLTPAGLLTPVARFQAELTGAGGTEARGESIFFVRHKFVWDTYEPVLWLTRNGVSWNYDVEYFRLLREVMWIPNGWDSRFHPRGSAYYQMVYGGFNRVGWESLHFFSMNHNWTQATFEHRRRNFNKTKDLRWLYRTPVDRATKKPVDRPDYAKTPFGNNPHNSYFPLDDPAYHDWTKRKIAAQIQRIKQFNPIIYDLMDEGSYTSYARAFDFDFSPVSLKHFRTWLKGQYGTLAALNAEWETQFKTWDDVLPMHIHQVRARAKGKKLPDYAPWVDHRKYNDIVYNRYIKLCSDAARAGGDDDACVGIGGGQRPNPYGGWDYWLVTNHFTWIENYFADTNEYMRSFNTPDRRLKGCPGADVWYSLMHGNCGFYRWVDYGHLNADFSLLPRGSTTARQLAEVRGRGFGKLFLAARPVDDPVGIHYSQSTIQLAYALRQADQYGNGGPLWPKYGFYTLLEELGYQYKFVAYAQVESGELIKQGYKLMILPESAALSDKEAQQLRKFVEAGGVLLCDRDVGTWNDHGRKRAKTVLAETFGMDPAQAAEKKLGKGEVVYLNSDFPRQYWADRGPGEVAGHWKRMQSVLAKAGLPKPRARLLYLGKPARRTEVRYFQLGKIRYHAVAAEIDGKYTFVNAAPGHLYDMRERRYGGAAGRIDIDAAAGFPALVALSPYRIQRVEAKALPERVEPGKAVRIAAAVHADAKPDVHAVNFRVWGPDGKERRWYGRTLLGQGGKATLKLQTALSDAKGRWTVKASDLASGLVGEAAFEVK